MQGLRRLTALYAFPMLSHWAYRIWAITAYIVVNVYVLAVAVRNSMQDDSQFSHERNQFSTDRIVQIEYFDRCHFEKVGIQ
jgi:hypothetical protein